MRHTLEAVIRWLPEAMLGAWFLLLLVLLVTKRARRWIVVRLSAMRVRRAATVGMASVAVLLVRVAVVERGAWERLPWLWWGPPPFMAAEIYVLNADGSACTRLTHSRANDVGPSWAPDGRRIAFVSDCGDDPEICVMNAHGTGLANLTDHPAYDLEPSWSPDGSRIAFRSNREEGYEIWVMDADGRNPTRLTRRPTDALGPVWSPDGKRIAFCSYAWHLGVPCQKVFVINADGSNLQKLTVGPDYDRAPAWSPDGSRIAFVRREADSVGLCVVEASGGKAPVQLTSVIRSDQDLTWSPDGSSIAFSRGHWEHPTADQDVYQEHIYVMNADGSGENGLTDPSGFDSHPAWSPDGSRIAYTSDRREARGFPIRRELRVMNADGSRRLCLMTGLQPSFAPWDRGPAPAWSPDGSRIALASVPVPPLIDAQMILHLASWLALGIFGPLAFLSGLRSWRERGSETASVVATISGAIPALVFIMNVLCQLWALGLLILAE